MKNKRTINENLREAASKRSRKLDSIVAASKTSLSRNFSRLPSTVDYLQESTKNLKNATKRDVKQAIDYSQGMIDWSRKGNIDLMGTSYNPTPAEVPFSFGDALVFDGNDDYVEINTALNTTEFTVSLWFNLPTVAANNRIVAGAISTDWIDVRSSGVINIRLSSGGVNFTVPSISSSTWYHLLVARNSSSQTRLFLNGVESSSGTQVVLGNCTYSSLGRQIGGGFTACVLDDCLFNSSYGNPATESEAIYNGGEGADPLISIPLAEQLYRFNENLNNDGSLGGSATGFNLAANPYIAHV